MVNTNSYPDNKWSKPSAQKSVVNYNKWHQSPKPGRNMYNRPQTDFVQRQIKREKETAFVNPLIRNQVRHISKECKEALKKKMEEIRVHNNKLAQKQALIERHRNYVCFHCKLRGHIARNCPAERQTNTTASPGIITQTPPIQITYPESIHLSTDFMVEGTDDHGWDQIWYVSNKINRHVCCNMSLFSKLKEKFLVEKNEEQKKFIFIHGIGEVQIKIDSEIFVIPGVHYTP